MMNAIWLGIIIVSILVAGFTGRMHQLTLRSFASAKEAVDLAISLIGIMAFWLGLMRVASAGGLLRLIARALRRPMRWLFPGVPEDHPAMSAMILNFAANMLGLAEPPEPLDVTDALSLALAFAQRSRTADLLARSTSKSRLQP